MNRALPLRLHRWTSLVFALPLLVVVGTGLILSFEPIAHHAAVRPGSLTTARALPLLARHDPWAQARAVNLRPHDNLLVLTGARPGPPVAVDLSTGEEVRAGNGVTWSDLFVTSRRLHARSRRPPRIPTAARRRLGARADDESFARTRGEVDPIVDRLRFGANPDEPDA